LTLAREGSTCSKVTGVGSKVVGIDATA